jgi:hypothetical protein
MWDPGLERASAKGPSSRRTPQGLQTGRRGYNRPNNRSREGHMLFILWLIAVVLVISGIVTIVRGSVLFGVLLIILGLLVGPGGVSIFN